LTKKSWKFDDYVTSLLSLTGYSPIFLGLAETYLNQEKENLKIVFDGRAIECAQNVVNFITRLVELIDSIL